jgi:hypothetical protein
MMNPNKPSPLTLEIERLERVCDAQLNELDHRDVIIAELAAALREISQVRGLSGDPHTGDQMVSIARAALAKTES